MSLEESLNQTLEYCSSHKDDICIEGIKRYNNQIDSLGDVLLFLFVVIFLLLPVIYIIDQDHLEKKINRHR